ncbi:MAG: radical SAM protein [Alphaproteobacteria bacterium]|nr:radical SAM protein [Alphaproteobacteria bacterium]
MSDWRLISIPFLEMDIAYACDLHCQGCSHYSNYGIKGTVPFAEGEVWLRDWAARLKPGTFSMLGGEPALNPDLFDYLRLAQELWPDSTRILISNGLNHHLRPGLFDLLAETKTRLDISFHSHQDKQYVERFNEALIAIEVARARLGFDMVLRTKEYRFHRIYQGEGAGMRPFEDQDPVASWKACQNSSCCTIHQGMLWKCPPLAYLGLIKDRFGLDRVEAWKPYLAYRPLAPTVPEEELVRFFLAGAESVCGMCPAKLEFHEQGLISKQRSGKD